MPPEHTKRDAQCKTNEGENASPMAMYRDRCGVGDEEERRRKHGRGRGGRPAEFDHMYAAEHESRRANEGRPESQIETPQEEIHEEAECKQLGESRDEQRFV